MSIFDNTDWVTAYTVSSSMRSVENTISRSSLGLSNILHQTNNSLDNMDSALSSIYQTVNSSNEFLSDISFSIRDVNNSIQSAVHILENISKNITSPNEVKANEYYRIARANIDTALKLSGHRAEQMIEEAKDLCHKSIELFDYNYSAHFDLGWIYYAIENNPNKAKQYFERAITTSLSRDQNFAILSFRNLFQVYLALDDFKMAGDTINEACKIAGVFNGSLKKTNNPELLHDLVFSMSISKDYDNVEKKLNSIMRIWPAYYNIFSSEALLPEERNNQFYQHFVEYEITNYLVPKIVDFADSFQWTETGNTEKDREITKQLCLLESNAFARETNYYNACHRIDDFKSWLNKVGNQKKEFDHKIANFNEILTSATNDSMISNKEKEAFLERAPKFPV